MKKLISIFLIAFTFSTLLKAEVSNLDLNDVSVLLPLPDLQHWDQLPSGLTAAQFGDLLPLSYFSQVPQILAMVSNKDIYPALKVIGVRIDPCFHEGVGPTLCQSQIRLVWQPLAKTSDVTSTFDASLHSFYSLSKDEFKELAGSLIKLKLERTNSNEILPLGVNPFIEKEGLQGDYAQKFFKIIYKYIGEEKLNRITFMKLFMNGNIWEFGGFDITHSNSQTFEMKPLQIPNINSTSQLFTNKATPKPFWFKGGIDPAPQTEDNLNFLVTDSRLISPQQNETDIKNAVRSAYKFENPALHNPGTADCVSCHIAQAAKNWSLNQYPWFNLSVLNSDVIYDSEKDLSNFSPMQGQTNILRAFGYFMNAPITSQRVINESSEVVKAIHASFN
jgi:hypothetical protein